MLVGSTTGVKPRDIEILEFVAGVQHVVEEWPPVNGRCACNNPECTADPGKHPVKKGWGQVYPVQVEGLLREGRNFALLLGGRPSATGRYQLVAVDVDDPA